MAKGAEKQRRKEMWKAEQARRDKQAATKERLLREQALRRARELAGNGPERPLAGLAKTEAAIKAKQQAAQAPAAQQAAPAKPAGPSRLNKFGGWLKAGVAGMKGYLAGKLTSKGDGEEKQKSPPSQLTGWIFFFVSIILYWFVDLATGYNGIDIGFFIGLGGADWLYKSGILTIIAIILAFQFIFSRPESGAEFKSDIFLDIVLAFVFIIARYSVGALYHAIFILGIWFFLLRPVKSRIDANRTLAILILIDFIGFSALEYLLSNTGFLGGAGIVANYVMFPIFSLYLLGYLKVYGKSGLASFLLFLIVVLYIFGFVRNSPQYQTLTSEIDLKQREEAWGFWKTSIFRTKEFAGMILDPLGCSSLMGVSSSDYEDCLRERQYDRLCAEYGRGTEEYENCIKQKQGLDVTGTTDKTIKEFTKIEFKQPKEFPKQVQKEFSPPIPMQLNIESPKKPVTIELSCKFKTAGEEFDGDVQPKKIEEIIGTKELTVLCDKPSDKEYKELKSYTVTYTAKVEGIETESTLTRLFVGKELDEKEKSSLLSLHELTQTESSKSAEEFAVFSFGIGTPPTNPFINNNPTQVIIGNIENLANGKILAIENIEVNLINHITLTPACLKSFTQSGNSLILKPEVKNKLVNLKTKKGERLFLLGCNLQIGSDLAETKDYVKRGFSSKMTYTYEITKEGKFTVAKNLAIT
ncbi:hypothetical protein KY343_03455 [Candidatus Woesearchaeota archaeon]|nr:hypothetical protein [Candidatus Woesearchaeota archaeon]